MSYILDALRRADAERQQGQVPGLHATVDGPVPSSSAGRKVLVWWGAGAALVVLAVLIVVWWPRPQTQPVAGQQSPPAVAVPAALGGARSEGASALAAASAPTPMAAPTLPTLPIVVSAAPLAPAAAPVSTPTLSAPASAAVAAPASAAVAGPAAVPLPKPVPLQQLGPEQRRELPRLVVGGSVWSDSAASRFIVLDGQVLREGDTVAPGLVLERIQPKSAVLRWREMRLELSL